MGGWPGCWRRPPCRSPTTTWRGSGELTARCLCSARTAFRSGMRRSGLSSLRLLVRWARQGGDGLAWSCCWCLGLVLGCRGGARPLVDDGRPGQHKKALLDRVVAGADLDRGRPAGWIRSKEKREGLAWPCCCALNLQRRGSVAAGLLDTQGARCCAGCARLLLTAAGIGRPWMREDWPWCCSNEERGEGGAAASVGRD